MWGGRFRKKSSAESEEFTRSLRIDKRLFAYDIEASIAHTEALQKCGVLNKKERDIMIKALKDLKKEGEGTLDLKAEDIHTAIEKRLRKKIGDLTDKLHTGRSRNDLVVASTKLYLKKEIEEIKLLIIDLLKNLIFLAEKNLKVIMPGHTHFQPAQPVLVAHYLLSYFEMFYRDLMRLKDSYQRMDVLPLGAGALAGVSFDINPEFLAKMLNFSQISSNSIDAVSDRDFIIEFIAVSSIMMMHLSRFSEELVIFSHPVFSFIEIDERFCTGSSIMPQKKNPDVVEIIRGKAGSIYGNLIGILVLMKGLPLAYNRDMQEDKKFLFETVDTIKSSLKISSLILKSLKFNEDKLKKVLEVGFLCATDLADYLVKKGISFRQAHNIVGRMIIYAEQRGKRLEDLTLKELKKFSSLIDEEGKNVLNIKKVVERKNITGGTSTKQVKKELQRAKDRIRRWEEKI